MRSSKQETAIETKFAAVSNNLPRLMELTKTYAGGTRLAPTEAEWRSESAKHKAIRKYHKVKKTIDLNIISIIW